MDRTKQLPLGAKAGGLSFSATVLINLIVSLFGSAIILIGSLQGTDAAKYVSVLVSPIAIAIMLTLALTVAKQPAREILPVKAKPQYFAIGLLLIFGLLFSLSWVNEYVVKLFELMGYKPKGDPLPDVSGWKIVPVLITFAVLPAIMEEILFRGILLFNVERGVGSLRAIFIAGFCFAIYHGSVEQTVYQFICGCLFAFLAVRSRSLTPVIVIHFLNNAVIVILNAVGVVNAAGNLVAPQYVQIILYVLSAIALVGGIVWLVLDTLKAKRAEEKEAATENAALSKESQAPATLQTPDVRAGVKTFFAYSAVGIAAMVLLWVAGLFL